MLIGFSAAPPGAILPLRSLLAAPQIPGSLQLPRERLRVPLAVGLPFFDVPLAPLLNRLDSDALLMLYVAMLSERRIMFVAQALPTLTACVHAAVALLQPFEWQNIFIPVSCGGGRRAAVAGAGMSMSGGLTPPPPCFPPPLLPLPRPRPSALLSLSPRLTDSLLAPPALLLRAQPVHNRPDAGAVLHPQPGLRDGRCRPRVPG